MTGLNKPMADGFVSAVKEDAFSRKSSTGQTAPRKESRPAAHQNSSSSPKTGTLPKDIWEVKEFSASFQRIIWGFLVLKTFQTLT